MKLVSVVGARPQLVKLAPIATAIATSDHRHIIVHTGQHYDADLSDVFFSGLTIPDPDHHLGIGSDSHGVQTGRMLMGLEPILTAEKPDWVLVYGDTNSTLAGAVCAVKQHLPVAHLEAGLRSFNRRMPEEHNRILTDHAADLLLAPTDDAMQHLAREGLSHRAVLVGDVMVDVCLTVRDAVLRGEHRVSPLITQGPTSYTDGYLVATIHRAENTDEPKRLDQLLGALSDLPLPVLLLAHPRLIARAKAFGITLAQGSVQVRRPLPYAEMVAGVMGCVGVITDSGGLQKEAYLLGRPCTTLREQTEWPQTLVGDWNRLVPHPGQLTRDEWVGVATRPAPTAPRSAPFGDGHAANRVLDVLAARCADSSVPPSQ
jgi:UDP-N-acetylglucosamine 2-epimerase (non-hydrolysing)